MKCTNTDIKGERWAANQTGFVLFRHFLFRSCKHALSTFVIHSCCQTKSTLFDKIQVYQEFSLYLLDNNGASNTVGKASQLFKISRGVATLLLNSTISGLTVESFSPIVYEPAWTCDNTLIKKCHLLAGIWKNRLIQEVAEDFPARYDSVDPSDFFQSGAFLEVEYRFVFSISRVGCSLLIKFSEQVH